MAHWDRICTMKHTGRILALILVVSVALRVAVAFYYGDTVDAPPLLTDQRSYHALGVRLLTGHGFSFASGWYPFTPANTPTAHWSFLYSLFIAGVYAIFGAHPLAARLANAILGGILLPLMVYRLAAQLFAPDEREDTTASAAVLPALPLIAAASAAIYGYFILYAAVLMTETAYIIALLWSLERGLCVARTLQRGESLPVGLALQLGLSLGIAALIRQAILPWMPVFFLWLLLNLPVLRPARLTGQQRVTLARLFLVPAVVIACILPWTIRNAIVYGDFLLLNSNTGYAMYSAQHPMHGTRFSEFAAAPIPEDLPRGTEPQMDRELMRRGIGFVLEDPVRYLRLSLSRVRAYFEFWPTPDSTLLHNVGRTGSFGLFLPFMLYGLYLFGKDHLAPTFRASHSLIERLREPRLLLLLFAAFYTLLHVLTWAMVRYRLPVDAVLLPFAALALLELARAILRRVGRARG